MRNFFQQSIQRKFFLLMLTVFVIILVATGTLFSLLQMNQTEYTETRDELTEKRDRIHTLQDNYNQMILRMRGFIATGSKAEFERAETYGELLLQNIEEVERDRWTSHEYELIKELELFVSDFWEETAPTTIELVEAENYASIREISVSGVTENVNDFIEDLAPVSDQVQNSLTEVNESYAAQQKQLSYMLIGLVFIVLVILAIVLRKLSQGIGTPLKELSIATQAIAQGKRYELAHSSRKDEIGTLANSFKNMAFQINDREDYLSAQNDELSAQQSTLESYIAELKNLKLALNQSSIVAILNKKGLIISSNDQLQQRSGYSHNELKDHHFLKLFNITDSSVGINEAFPGIEHGRVWKGELSYAAKNKMIYYADTTVVPYIDQNENVEQIIVVQQDITAIKETEEQLRQSLKETEETRSTVEKLNMMNQTLSTTMNKQELLEKSLQGLSLLYAFDYGLFLLVNSCEYTTLGLNENWIENKTDSSFDHVIERLKSTKEPYVIQRESGQEETLYYTSKLISYDLHSPILDSNGELLAILVVTRIGRDFESYEMEGLHAQLNRISLYIERLDSYEQTEVGRQLNQDIIDNINEGILFVDEDGGIIQYNKNWLDFLGISLEMDYANLDLSFADWMGQTNERVVDSEGFSEYCYRMIFRETNEECEYIFEVDYQEQSRIVQVYAETIIRENQKAGTLFVFRDITAQHEIDQMKTNLVSTVSHELRTPLASVLGYTELMIHRELKPDRQKKYLQTIHSEAKRLTNLINDFLDLQRMESGNETFRKEVVNLEEVIEIVLEGFEVNYPSHNVRWINEAVMSQSYIDREKIIQLLNNILGNAFKFSPSGGEVAVSLTNDQEQLYIHVSDEGIGIPEYEISKLFSKFHRIDNTSQRKIGGTGLGLAISKEIIEAHNGKISVLSEQGVGSVFTITLPLYKKSQIDQNYDETIKTIILLEDDKNLAKLLKDEIEDSGMLVQHYNEGGHVIEHLSTIKPDAFVIDIALADQISGWEVIEHIKTVDHLKNVPVIISSALDKSIQPVEVEGYLVKPYPPSKLSTILMHTLLHHRHNGDIVTISKE
ncbi:ATP-binding protein [Halobacillus seohaensis]|uniref:histidine kinase n=1 Tax=Halobacillus seohaensis TaxID=447421 RepID=A0ABW2EPJ0_9BACI